jgi:hypothetical protein
MLWRFKRFRPANSHPFTVQKKVLILFLRLPLGLLSSPPSRSGEGRVAIVIATRQRDAVAATMSGLNACGLRTRVGDPPADRRLTPTRRADGPSACPCDSSCGPGGVDASDNSRSAMQQAAKPIACGTQATICVRGLLPLPCAFAHGGHVLAHGAAGAVKRLSFRTPLLGKRTKRRPASPGAGRNTGR